MTDFDADGRDDFTAVLIDTKIPEENPDGSLGFNCVLAIFEAIDDSQYRLATLQRGMGIPEGCVLFRSKDDRSVIIGLWESSATPIIRQGNGTYDLSP